MTRLTADFDDGNKGVGAVGLEVALPALENVFDSLQRHRHDSDVWLVEEVDEGRNRPTVDKVLNLHVIPPRCCIADGPRALLADVKVLVVEHVDHLGDDPVVNHSLQLILAPSSDIRDGPAGLLADALAIAVEKGQKAGEDRAVDDELCLVVVPGNNVAHSAESRSFDLRSMATSQIKSWQTLIFPSLSPTLFTPILSWRSGRGGWGVLYT